MAEFDSVIPAGGSGKLVAKTKTTPLLDRRVSKSVAVRTDAEDMSNFNLLTHLIDHRDGRDGNILVSKDDEHRRVFAVDNGIAFGPWVYNFFVPNWTKLRVAAVRKDSIDRLREIRREDLDFLAVVAQLEVDEEGVLRPAPPGAPFDPDDGARVRGGSVHQPTAPLQSTMVCDCSRRKSAT